MRSAPPRPDLDDVPELRRLLLGKRRADVLDDLATGVHDQDAESISKILPDAVRLRANADSDLADALSSTIEQGLTTSVERNPKPVADAIFPIIFPAIRRAIQHALASSMQSVNQTLNYGFSWKGLKWRMEAMRTGSSFGEVVVKHTLRYRVEQVLLVHRETGLLLEHVVAPDVEAADADLVSAMLTAIERFVEDSFQVDDDEALDVIQMGDLTVWVEPGPHAVVAAVIRGQPRESLRESLTDSIETVHRRFSGALIGFEGNTAPFAEVRPVLEQCLESEYREDANKTSPLVWLILLAVLGGLGWWIFTSVRTAQRDNDYLEALDAAPGIEVIDADRRGGALHIQGLRDPFADDPASMLEAARLEGDDVVGEWAPYISIDPALVARRVTAVLGASETISFLVDNAGTLVGEGIAPRDWIAEASRSAPLIPGVAGVDFSQVRTPLQAVRDRLESLFVRIEGNGFEVAVGQEAAMEAVASATRTLAAESVNADGPVVLEIIGHTDDVGGLRENQALSARRAESVRAQLPPDVFAPGNLTVRALGVGATERLAEGDHPPSRRVTFHVVLPGNELTTTPPVTLAPKASQAAQPITRPAAREAAGRRSTEPEAQGGDAGYVAQPIPRSREIGADTRAPLVRRDSL